jgi:hypothetical protein
LEDEVGYLRLREKKIMYLIHIAQSKGYPVQNIYERELKEVDTMRIEEFLEEKEREHNEREDASMAPDPRYYYSFHTDDSFEPIADGPMLKPVKPAFVPTLVFDDLPEYETTSSEED